MVKFWANVCENKLKRCSKLLKTVRSCRVPGEVLLWENTAEMYEWRYQCDSIGIRVWECVVAEYREMHWCVRVRCCNASGEMQGCKSVILQCTRRGIGMWECMAPVYRSRYQSVCVWCYIFFFRRYLCVLIKCIKQYECFRPSNMSVCECVDQVYQAIWVFGSVLLQYTKQYECVRVCWSSVLNNMSVWACFCSVPGRLPASERELLRQWTKQVMLGCSPALYKCVRV